MTGPLAAISFIHGPMKRDLQEMAMEAHGLDEAHGSHGPTTDFVQLQQRYRLWCRVLEIHEDGEEQFLFPSIESVAPGTSAAYQEAHQRLAAALADVTVAMDEKDTHQVHRLLHRLERELNDHIDLEEKELLLLADEHIPQSEQAAIVGKMSALVPPDLLQEALAWMLRYQSLEEREGFLRMYQEVATPEDFGAVKAIAQQLLSEGEWSQLTERLPTLR